MSLGEILKTLVTSMGPLGWSVVVVSAPGCSRARVSALRLCKPPSQVRKGKDDRRLNEDPYLTSEANYPDDGRETSLRDLDG